jgi:hypothetical protein
VTHGRIRQLNGRGLECGDHAYSLSYPTL